METQLPTWSQCPNGVEQGSWSSIVAKSGANYANPGGLPVVSTEYTTVLNTGTPANGDALLLPAGVPGISLTLANLSGVEIAVFSGGTTLINGLAAGVYVTLTPNSVTQFFCFDKGGTPVWQCPGVGYGYIGNLPTQNVSAGLTAHAGGGQASGLLLNHTYSRFNTVATAGDSALLPPVSTGNIGNAAINLIVHNNSATSMNIFPAVGEAINALGANAAYALAGGKTATLTGTGGLWSAVLSA